jgi:hypothetical protein
MSIPRFVKVLPKSDSILSLLQYHHIGKVLEERINKAIAEQIEIDIDKIVKGE